MKVRYLKDENTPLRFVPAGSVCEVDDERALFLIDAGFAEAVPKESERAIKGARAATAVKK